MAKGCPFTVFTCGLLFLAAATNAQFFETAPSNFYTPRFDNWHIPQFQQPQQPLIPPQIPSTIVRRMADVGTLSVPSSISSSASSLPTTAHNRINTSPLLNYHHPLLTRYWTSDFNNDFNLNGFSDADFSIESRNADGSIASNSGNIDEPTIAVATVTNSRPEGVSSEEDREPFEVDVITSDVPHKPDTNFFFHHTIPFFESHPFFSNFAGFAGFGGNRREPWWKGPNVCTDRTEDEESDVAGSKTEKKDDSDEDTAVSIGAASQLFGAFQFSLNSCVEKPHKHVCKQVYNKNGKKKTVTISRQCCHGYGRARNADLTAPCEKIDLKPLMETAEEMGAKEFIKSAKNNGLDEKLSSNVTVFLPTDLAFTEFSEQMFENNLVVLPMTRARRAIASDPATGYTSKDLALNHMVDGWIDVNDVHNEDVLLTNYENSTIRINIFPKPPSSQAESRFRYTANCAPIVKANKITTNGMVHVVDRVLPPINMNLMEIIKQRDDMTVLRSILEKSNMNELLEGEKPLTVFAPTDKAFQKLDQRIRRTLKEAKGCAKNILRNHILDLTFCSVAVVSDAKTTAYNMLSEPMIFERINPKDEKSPAESELADLTGIQNIMINGKAKVIESDIMGTNGVLHVVDTIMPSESALPITSLMEKKNLTIFEQLIETSNLQNEFDDMNNVTFFIPNDKAFDGNVWKQKLEEDPDSLKDNSELKEFLNYHIVGPMTKTCDLAEKLVDTRAGQKLRINLYSTHALFTNVMNRATVNCARLMHFDDESCGSVMHQVDKVLTPPKMNLLQELESNPNYSKFLELIKLANLTNLLEDESSEYTLLVPKNDVLEETKDWLKTKLEKPNELEDMVKTHIVNDVVCCAGIIPTNWPFVRTIETINGGHLRISRDRRPKIEDAGVTKCDIIATNGIVHEINDVIVARKPQQQQSTITRPNRFPSLESFGDLIF